MHQRLFLILCVGALPACDAQQPRETNGEVTRERRAEPAIVLGLRSTDADVRAAARAVAEGTPWLGTMRIAAALADPVRRTPEARLVAARAAAGWEGWTEVERQLAGEPWIGELAGGEAHALLARSAMAREADTLALRHAESAVRATSDEALRGPRLVLLARALDRTNALDSAAASYRRAAELMPLAGDWLRLRAAGVTGDDGARQRLYARISDTVARARVRVSEAQALERLGRRDDAARAWTEAGDRVSALRLRLAGAPDDHGLLGHGHEWRGRVGRRVDGRASGQRIVQA